MSKLIIRARGFAALKHAGQVRKYTGEPYFNHCINVANLVRTVPHIDAMVAAAYLHDTVEDTGTTLDEIEHQFGRLTRDLVYWLTDTATMGNRATRKAADRARLADAPPEAKTIKLADLIDNSASIVKYDPQFAKVYLREKRLLLDVLRGGDADLWKRANAILIKEWY